MSMMREEKGFTLIEIMIVITVIAFILGIAIPGAIKARRSSMRYTCIGNLRQIDSAKSIWSTEHSGSPIMEDLVPDYVRVAPECPSGGTYTLGAEAENTVCSIESHVIQEGE